MAEKVKCLILKFRPNRKELMFSEDEVKKLMYEFARDLGCKWRASKLRAFIESAFED